MVLRLPAVPSAEYGGQENRGRPAKRGAFHFTTKYTCGEVSLTNSGFLPALSGAGGIFSSARSSLASTPASEHAAPPRPAGTGDGDGDGNRDRDRYGVGDRDKDGDLLAFGCPSAMPGFEGAA